MDQQEMRERSNGIEREEYEESDDKPQKDDLSRDVPHWRSQLTVRGLVSSCIIGTIYSGMVNKLALTTGLIPNLNVSAALVAYVVIKCPFTKQENTVIQTCAVACYSVAIAGGFGYFLLGLYKKTYEQAGIDTPGHNPGSYKEPGIGWMTIFLFATGFVGLLAMVPLRKQIQGFAKFFSFSFVWGFFQWLYAGGDLCGFIQFPTFGLQAWKQSFFFDFSMTYVGAGMICSHLVNLSTLFGAVLSYRVMWPLIRGLKGEWYPATISEGNTRSLNGYKGVFISIALILGDGLYNFLRVVYLCSKNTKRTVKVTNEVTDPSSQSLKELQQDEVFMKDSIPLWVACAGYVLLSIVSIIAIPLMFPQLKWYHVVVCYLLAPFLGFCNAYGAGLTDMNMAYNYGKVALFILPAISVKENGVVAGLVGVA
ncbi:hypothetical protein MKX01_029202, partial [Papaver californicum]